MSLLAQKNYKNVKNKSQRSKSQNRKNEKLSAIEELKRLYHKYNLYPTTSLLNQLNSKYIKIFFNEFSIRDITVLSQILSEFYFLQSIQISPHDPEKPEEITSKRKYLPAFVLQKENKRKLKERKMKQVKYKTMFNKIIYALAKQISKSKQIISLLLNKLEFNEKYSQILSKSISDNNSLQNFGITNCKLDLNSYEILLESLLNQNVLSFLDLSNNDFGDKYGYMISRIISRHSQRRDQVIWFYSLRNELPPSNEYKKGLMFINLNGNNLSKDSAECISSVLYSDQYIRAIYLNNNKFDNSSCKKFIYMMRKNLTILTIDLRENPGYDEDIHHRLVIKMSKNIRYLFQQYKLGEYTEEEFEQLKEFIDISFFDVDIPQEIVDYYNGNIQDTLEDNGEELNDQLQLDNMNVMNDIQERAEEEEDDETIKTMKEKGESKSGHNLSMSNNKNTEEENKKLIEENQKLKQKIMELKSQNENNKQKILIKPDDPNNIEENYSYIINLISELNEVMNNIEKIKNKKENNINNKNNNIQENIQKNKEDIYIQNEENHQIENNIINSNKVAQEQNVINDNNIPQNENQEESGNIMGQEINLENLKEKEEVEDLNQEQELEQNDQEQIQSEENMQEINNENNNVIQNENNEINLEGVEMGEEGDNEDEEINLDDLTEEEKMALLQQREILQKLQEEAEAKGEHFDVQEYLEMLEKQANEEEEEEGDNKEEEKINKSF